ncbi:hypothetical protein JYT74_01310 [Crocinitomix catalasitica]|nr:hypothetical protein [Crocinitomix catalasitica]
MNMFYQTIEISKQAVHQYCKRQEKFNAQVIQLIQEVDELRKEHPGCGVEKMYHVLKPDFIVSTVGLSFLFHLVKVFII